MEPQTFSLMIEPVPALASLGARVELHEISVGAVKRTILEAAENNQSARWADMLLARCLWVDGEPIGLAALDELPGRYTEAVNAATKRCMVLHGYGRVIGEPESAEEDDAPGEASAPSGE
jgi:hypothetical protein